jgi:uncharacterized protein
MPVTVSNSTPLIHLAKIGQLHLLPELFGTLLIPQAVYTECVLEGRGYEESTRIAQARWLQVVPVVNQTLLTLLNSELDKGEAEAIVLALERQADRLLLDDTEGRNKARLYGLPYTGTLGILLRARQVNKLNASFRATLDALQASGFWLDKHLYQRLIQEAGE